MVWDEAHFGKFGSHYLKREFYFDVHPPLGKMLVGLAGLLTGYDGNFEFKSGELYPESVPYVAMRVMMATYGVALVPLGWYTAVELGLSPWACHLVALMVLCGMSCIFFDVVWSLTGCTIPQTLHGYVFRGLFSWIRCCYSLPLPRSFSSLNSIISNFSESVCVLIHSERSCVVQFVLFRLVDVAYHDGYLNWLCDQVSWFSLSL